MAAAVQQLLMCVTECSVADTHMYCSSGCMIMHPCVTTAVPVQDLASVIGGVGVECGVVPVLLVPCSLFSLPLLQPGLRGSCQSVLHLQQRLPCVFPARIRPQISLGVFQSLSCQGHVSVYPSLPECVLLILPFHVSHACGNRMAVACVNLLPVMDSAYVAFRVSLCCRLVRVSLHTEQALPLDGQLAIRISSCVPGVVSVSFCLARWFPLCSVTGCY